MKRLALILAILLIPVFSFAYTLNLKATWTGNTEPDMKEYRLYRTDGTRTLIGTIAHPTTVFNFSQTVADNTSGTMKFVLVAVDTNNNVSLDSTEASYNWNSDIVPPTSPKQFIVIITIP